MKKLSFLLLGLCFMVSAFAESKNLDKMSEKKRTEHLIKEAKEIVMKYGPGFYRDTKPPVIKRYVIGKDESILATWTEQANQGRSFYCIEYLYDETEESFYLKYAARVFFWGDTGKPIEVSLGAGRYFDLEDPITGTSKDKRFWEYKKTPPVKKQYWEK